MDEIRDVVKNQKVEHVHPDEPQADQENAVFPFRTGWVEVVEQLEVRGERESHSSDNEERII